jgi:hypothetical protein
MVVTDKHFSFLSIEIIHRLSSFKWLTPQITGGKKQSEAALFAVRVHLPC